MVLFSTKAAYSCSREIRKGTAFVLIADRCSKGFPSVTNTIDAVIEEVRQMEHIQLEDHTFIYRDSSGVWDGYDPIAKQFNMLGSDNPDDAMDLIISRVERGKLPVFTSHEK